MKKIESIFKLLDEYGLMITDQSGGFSAVKASSKINSEGVDLELNVDDERVVRFYDPSLFLESIQTTEKALNLKLFV